MTKTTKGLLLGLLLAAAGCIGPSTATIPPPPPPPPMGPPPSGASAVAPGAALPSPTSSPNAARPSTSAPAVGANDPTQKIAELGTCNLESGAKIEGCRLGYRTFGTLDAKRSNAVLFPTWFTGTTKPLEGIVPDKLVDTKKLFVILVDALGDGISSSPSNSRTQPRLSFPKFTIHDMVEAERRLVTETLGIQHLHTVMGISMGGMQAFDWAVSFPDLVDRFVSIVGTPQLTSNDLLLWTSELHAIESDVAYKGGDYEGRPPIRAVLDVHNLALVTPAYRAEQTKNEQFPAWVAAREAELTFDWNDWHRQLEAMMAHDLGKPYGGIAGAAKRVKAKGLVVVAEQDHMVSPITAKAFAKAMNAKLVVLEGPCGHLAPGCEGAKLNPAVTSFLMP